MKEVRVLINGLETNYKIAGSGPAILVLHGWGGSSDSWVKVQEILSEKGYQVIVPDFPGFGESANPPVCWGAAEYADFILQFAEKLELDKFFLLGHSFGGRAAIKFSTLHSNKLNGLILVGSAGLLRNQNLSLRQKVIINGAKFFHCLDDLPILNILYNYLRKAVYIFSGTRDYYSLKSQVMKETFRKVIEEDLADYLPSIRNKTLIVWGEKDRLTPINIAHLLKEKIAGSQLEIMPGVRHSPHLEAPEKLTEIILKFLNK